MHSLYYFELVHCCSRAGGRANAKTETTSLTLKSIAAQIPHNALGGGSSQMVAIRLRKNQGKNFPQKLLHHYMVLGVCSPALVDGGPQQGN